MTTLRPRKRQKHRQWYRQGGECHYCKRTMSLKMPHNHPEDDRATWDHLTPRSRGGKNIWKNKCLACLRCNAKKGTMTEEEFREFLRLEDQTACGGDHNQDSTRVEYDASHIEWAIGHVGPGGRLGYY